MAVLSIGPDALTRIDWDFPNAGTGARSLHSLHWFPGNFIRQIPSTLIQALSVPNDLVFDPFGGSGTTLIEALRLGRQAIHSDRLAPSVLVAKGKLALLQVGLSETTQTALLNGLTWDYLCRTDEVGAHGEGSHPRLEAWYAPGTLAQLRYIWKLIERQEDCSQQAILRMLFSDLLFSCAAPGNSKTATGKQRRHHWGWVADNVVPPHLREHDAVRAFLGRIRHAANIPVSRPRSMGAFLAMMRATSRWPPIPWTW